MNTNTNTILPYKDWLVEYSKSASDSLYAEYLEYVHDWYEVVFDGKDTTELSINEYKEFLLSLQIVTNDSDINKFIAKLNHTNEDEVEIAIPFLAKTLRDSARYISKKRDDSKYITNDYTYANSQTGLVNVIGRSLLEYLISTNNGADIGGITNGMKIVIDELYDDNSYHDKCPEATASDYFDTEVNSEFYGKCTPEYMSWAISSGFNNTYSNNDLLNPISGDSPNVPLSGYLTFDPTSELVSHFQGELSRHGLGEEQFYISGESGEYGQSLESYAKVVNPWNNISNRFYPTIATLPLIDNLHSERDIGGYNIPSKLGLPVAIGRNKYHTPESIKIEGSKKQFPNPDFYSNGYSFTNKYQDSTILYNSYLNWIDVRQSSGTGSGILSNNNKFQEMIPYQTSEESSGITNLGINQVYDTTDPWFLRKDSTWEDNDGLPPDFRNIYDTNAWYNNVKQFNGIEDQWGIDIYGNNYGVYKDMEDNGISNKILNRRLLGGGKLYIRTTGGRIVDYSDFLHNYNTEDFNNIDIGNLRSCNVYNDIILLEDTNGNFLIQTIIYDNDKYISKEGSTINSIDIDSGVVSSPLGHFYDNNSNSLYIGRYETVIDGFVEFTIYKYQYGNICVVYTTKGDTSLDIDIIRRDYKCNNIIPSPVITIGNDTLYVVYGSTIDSKTYMLIFPFQLTNNTDIKLSEVIIIIPDSKYTPVKADYATEQLYLLDVLVSDNLIIILEGSLTANKYLEVITL